MGVPLNSGTGSSTPALKLRNVGDYVDFAVAGIKTIPRTEYGTGQPRLSREGKPQTQIVLTVVIAGGTGSVKIGDDEVSVSEAVDQVAACYIAGRDRWDKDGDAQRKADGKQSLSWSGALSAHGQLEVGDVVRYTYEADVPGQGTVPRKLRVFRIRKAKPEEQARTEKCLAVHRNETVVPLSTDDGSDDPF